MHCCDVIGGIVMGMPSICISVLISHRPSRRGPCANAVQTMPMKVAVKATLHVLLMFQLLCRATLAPAVHARRILHWAASRACTRPLRSVRACHQPPPLALRQEVGYS